MVLGLQAAPYEAAMVFGVDFPLVSHVVLSSILARLGDRVAVVPRSGPFLQPLVAAYAPRARDGLAAAIERGERSLVAAVHSIEPYVIEHDAFPSFMGTECFLNVNTPEDLAEAERLLTASERR